MPLIHSPNSRTSKLADNLILVLFYEMILLTQNSVYGDQWFDQLVENVHPAISERQKGTDVSVTVTIIDTGIDCHHPLLRNFIEQGQIECKSFVEGVSNDQDACGHGTHVAHLVLKVAPRVKLYIARVFVSGQAAELLRNKGHIAEAGHAVGESDFLLTMQTGDKMGNARMEN
jgi:hypothetical protein